MRTRMLPAVAVLLAGCSAGVARPGAPGGFDPRALGGPCHARDGGDREATGSYLTHPGAWVRVDGVDLRSPAPYPRSDDAGVYRGRFVDEGGDASVADALPREMTELGLSHRTAEAAAEALAAGATVYAHVRPYPDRERYAWVALALTETDFAYLGECAYEDFTGYVRDLLGDRAPAELRALVGEPSTVTRKVLNLPRGFPADAALARTPTDVRERLRRGTFSVAAPPGWTVPYRLCAGLREGWGGCLDLSTPAGARGRAELWVDPLGDNPVQLWLMDPTGDLTYPAERHEEYRVAGGAFATAADPFELRLDLGNVPSGAAAEGRALLGAAVEFEVRSG